MGSGWSGPRPDFGVKPAAACQSDIGVRKLGQYGRLGGSATDMDTDMDSDSADEDGRVDWNGGLQTRNLSAGVFSGDRKRTARPLEYHLPGLPRPN